MKRSILLLVILLMILPPGALAQEDEGPELYLTPNGEFLVVMPDGWTADGGAELLTIASSEETLDLAINAGDIPRMPAGEAAIQMSIIPLEALEIFGLNADASQVDMMSAIRDSLTTDNPAMSFLSPPQPIEVRGQPAAISQGATNGSDVAFIVYQIVPGSIGLAVIVTAYGAFFEMQDELLDHLSNIHYAITVEESFEDDALQIDYPEEWYINTSFVPDAYVVTNQLTYFEAESPEDLAEGQVALMFYNLSTLETVVEDDPEATVTKFAETLLVSETDDITLSEPVTYTIFGRDVTGVSITADEHPQAGVFINEAYDGKTYAVVYKAAGDQAPSLMWLAINMLLRLDPKA